MYLSFVYNLSLTNRIIIHFCGHVKLGCRGKEENFAVEFAANLVIPVQLTKYLRRLILCYYRKFVL